MSMTLGRAVAWFEDRVKSTPMPGAREMFKIAAAAIREKAEREDPKPLTLEELRQTIGTPVYIVRYPSCIGEWAIFTDCADYGFCCGDETFYFANSYGTRWKAYRHKPKEVKHE